MLTDGGWVVAVRWGGSTCAALWYQWQLANCSPAETTRLFAVGPSLHAWPVQCANFELCADMAPTRATTSYKHLHAEARWLLH